MAQYGGQPQYGGAPPPYQQPQYGGAPPSYQQQPHQQPYQQQHASPQSSYGAPPASSAPYGAPPPSYQAAPQYGGQAPQYGASTPAHTGTYQQGPPLAPIGSYSAPARPPAPGVDPNVAAWFHAIDTDRTNSVDVKELQKALAMGSLNYGLSDVDQMVRAFDTKGARSLNMAEFVKLHDFLNNVTNSFNYFDTAHRKSLDVNQLMQALKNAGFTMDPPVVQAMFKRHDPDNTNSLSLDEYIRMCLFLQSCVRTFGAFDSQKTGRITLDFNQFVYASSHV